MRLPIKSRVLEYAILKNSTFSSEEVAKKLQEEYKGGENNLGKKHRKDYQYLLRSGNYESCGHWDGRRWQT